MSKITSDSIIEEIVDELEYPNHWVGENGAKHLVDGVLLIKKVISIEPKFKSSNAPIPPNLIFDPNIVPEPFLNRAHFCAEFETNDGHKLLIVKFDKKEPYSFEEDTHYYEDVAVYWNRDLVAELHVRDYWSHVTSAKQVKEIQVHDDHAWGSEIEKFHSNLLYCKERWNKELDEIRKTEDAKKAAPKKI